MSSKLFDFETTNKSRTRQAFCADLVMIYFFLLYNLTVTSVLTLFASIKYNCPLLVDSVYISLN